MPIGPDSPNFMVIDFFIIMWFVAMAAGIITDQTFMWFDYLFSALGGLYFLLRLYLGFMNWLESRKSASLRRDK